MNKNPLVLLLAISGVCFLLFLVFVFFVLSSFLPGNEQKFLALKRGEYIGVLPLEGVIMESRKTVEQIKSYEEDNNIRGVILRVNSPGGMVAPSQEIHDAILHLRTVKPVVASFESYAASGAYYVAVAADKIVSDPGTITGSIGVIMQFLNLSDLYKWAKVQRYSITSGPYKDVGADYRSMTPEERAVMQGMINNVYLQFVKTVSQDRKIPLEKIKSLADGRIYSGEQAHQLGLVDVLGGLDVAVDELRTLAKLGEKPVLIYPQPKKHKLSEIFSSQISNSVVSLIQKTLGGTVESAPAPGFLPLYLAPGFHSQ